MKTLIPLLLLLPFLTAPAMAGQCESAPLAAALEALRGVGRLHQCEIEVVARDLKESRVYLLFARDLTPAGTISRAPVTFELRLDRECVQGIGETPISGRVIRQSYGYVAPDTDYRVALSLAMGLGRYPRELLLQNINLATGAVEARVDCRSAPEDL